MSLEQQLLMSLGRGYTQGGKRRRKTARGGDGVLGGDLFGMGNLGGKRRVKRSEPSMSEMLGMGISLEQRKKIREKLNKKERFREEELTEWLLNQNISGKKLQTFARKLARIKKGEVDIGKQICAIKRAEKRKPSLWNRFMKASFAEEKQLNPDVKITYKSFLQRNGQQLRNEYSEMTKEQLSRYLANKGV